MEKIAIIGGGIAGLTAAYLLNPQYHITLFEKDNRVGGNACTHQAADGTMLDIAVGSVLNRVAQNFLLLCRELRVPMMLQPKSSLISIHDLDSGKGIYLTFLSLRGLMAQRFGLFTMMPLFLRIMHANYRAVRRLKKGELKGLSVAAAYDLNKFSAMERYMLVAPLCLLSSMPYSDVVNGPAEFFIAKMQAHGQFNPLLTMLGNCFPRHFTQSYIDALANTFAEKIQLNTALKTVVRTADEVKLVMDDGHAQRFDKIVFACNADQSLALLERPTPHEEKLLGAWSYQDVPMVVHRDHACLPPRACCQPWNCIQSPLNGEPHFSISYCSWLLSPSVASDCEYVSTQHAGVPIAEDKIDCEKHFRVPIYDFASFATLSDLPSLNGNQHSYFCGSHFGFGLHGDAVNSAIAVAGQLGIDCMVYDRPSMATPTNKGATNVV
ncbi:MAG: FAD-dependent oxidoreductase [Thermodesulfobacteriota bacterium]|nr:FAD-dependent oxidoreductase [Thermodesulfobacteriota bacterium]